MTYSGTPLRPKDASSAAISGLLLVQSAFRYTTPRRAKASVTAWDWSATRSLTRHVMHQAAVKFTNTGVPCARSAARRSGVKGSHAPPAGAAVADDADGLVVTSGPSAMAAPAQPRAMPGAARRP